LSNESYLDKRFVRRVFAFRVEIAYTRSRVGNQELLCSGHYLRCLQGHLAAPRKYQIHPIRFRCSGNGRNVDIVEKDGPDCNGVGQDATYVQLIMLINGEGYISGTVFIIADEFTPRSPEEKCLVTHAHGIASGARVREYGWIVSAHAGDEMSSIPGVLLATCLPSGNQRDQQCYAEVTLLNICFQYCTDPKLSHRHAFTDG
jgi:hypothetical protein